MAKCQTCRENDAELLTTWERLRNWKFRKLNYIFFTQDFEDLKSEKYTQGYSDGYIAGTEKQRAFEKEQRAIYG